MIHLCPRGPGRPRREQTDTNEPNSKDIQLLQFFTDEPAHLQAWIYILQTIILFGTPAADYAASRGIVIADTKFEFGTTPNGIVLADEVLTPDSSRFWPAAKYQPGQPQESL